MKAQFGENKEDVVFYSDPSVGNFALEPEKPSENEAQRSPHWDHCREQFAAKYKSPVANFYFAHPPDKGNDIAEFLTKFENVCGIENFSLFRKTNKKIILWVEPSKFWLNCFIKRSLLTLIIRCGINYDTEKDNFDDCLFGDYKECLFLKETKLAVLRFMFGFTKWTSEMPDTPYVASIIKHGWREEFQKCDEAKVKSLLILPEGKSVESSLVGIDSLWT